MKHKQPDRYYQKRREEQRISSIRFARETGGTSRHEEDPDGSRVWVETGVWPVVRR